MNKRLIEIINYIYRCGEQEKEFWYLEVARKDLLKLIKNKKKK